MKEIHDMCGSDTLYNKPISPYRERVRIVNKAMIDLIRRIRDKSNQIHNKDNQERTQEDKDSASDL